MRKLPSLCALLIAIVLSFSLVGCSAELPYHPEFYDNAASWIREDFQAENPVGGVDPDAEGAELPKSRVFIVSDEAEYQKIFLDDVAELDADLSEKMLIVYTFSTEYVRPAKLTGLQFSGGVLTVNYKINLIPGTGSAVKPFQRWFVLKLDKLGLSSVNFAER